MWIFAIIAEMQNFLDNSCTKFAIFSEIVCWNSRDYFSMIVWRHSPFFLQSFEIFVGGFINHLQSFSIFPISFSENHNFFRHRLPEFAIFYRNPSIKFAFLFRNRLTDFAVFYSTSRRNRDIFFAVVRRN